jgi:hypothetical protein
LIDNMSISVWPPLPPDELKKAEEESLVSYACLTLFCRFLTCDRHENWHGF